MQIYVYVYPREHSKAKQSRASIHATWPIAIETCRLREFVCAYVCTQQLSRPGLYDTGWRRLIGSPKLQIIFRKRATKYKSLLRKITYKDKGSYESSPPCNACICDETWRLYTCNVTRLLEARIRNGIRLVEADYTQRDSFGGGTYMQRDCFGGDRLYP